MEANSFMSSSSKCAEGLGLADGPARQEPPSTLRPRVRSCPSPVPMNRRKRSVAGHAIVKQRNHASHCRARAAQAGAPASATSTDSSTLASATRTLGAVLGVVGGAVLGGGVPGGGVLGGGVFGGGVVGGGVLGGAVVGPVKAKPNRSPSAFRSASSFASAKATARAMATRRRTYRATDYTEGMTAGVRSPPLAAWPGPAFMKLAQMSVGKSPPQTGWPCTFVIGIALDCG